MKVLERQPLDLESLESRTIGDYIAIYPAKASVVKDFLDSATVFKEIKTKDGRVEVTLLLPVDGPAGYKSMLAKLTGKGGELTKSGPDFGTPKIDDSVREILKSNLAARGPNEAERPYRLIIIPFENASELDKIDLGGLLEEQVVSRFKKELRFVFLTGEEANKALADNSLTQEVIHEADANTKVRVNGADGLLDGVITQFTQEVKKHGIGGAGFFEMTYTAKVELRVLDSRTGRWIYFDTIPAEATDRVFSVETTDEKIPALKASDFSDPANLASKTLNEMTKKIENVIRMSFPLMGYVLKVSGDRVYINLTKSAGLKEGDYLNVFRIGEELIDPLSGEAIDRIRDRIGTVRTIDVKDTYTQCVTSETPVEDIAPGDVVMIK
jgi:hypothetical protein